MRVLLVSILVVATCALRAPGQEPAPTPTDTPVTAETESAESVMAALDKKLYRAVDHGLNALSFGFRPVVMMPGVPPFTVRYWWHKDTGVDHVRFELEDGRLAEQAPSVLAEKTVDFLKMARAYGVQFQGGPRFSERFAHCAVRVSERMVNSRVERRLILEPRAPKNLKRLTIDLDRKGLPWQWSRLMLNGYTQVENHSFMEREEGFVLRTRNVIMEARRDGEAGSFYANEFGYQRVKGVLVPSSIKTTQRAESGGGSTPVEVQFLDVKINEDVPRTPPESLSK